MNKLIPSALALILCASTVHPAAADDELNMWINSLSITAARIRAISDNCKIAVDPALETEVIAALWAVPGLELVEVISHFADRRQLELGLRGPNCFPEDPDSLTTLHSIFERDAADLKKYLDREFSQ